MGMIRKATLEDAKKIQELVNYYAGQDDMLPRAISEVYENIRDFFVYAEKGKIYGCATLHICWENLAEIKSLAVSKSRWARGIGTKLVEACIKEAKRLKIRKIFVLTYKPDFFKQLGFRRVPRSKLPHKVWSECINCPKFPKCDEVPLIMEL